MTRRERQRRRERYRGSPVKKTFMLGAIVVVCAVALSALGVVGWVVGIADSAPDISQLKPVDQGQVSQVFTADGASLGFIHSNNLRTYAPDNTIPQALKQATVAIEDRRFYKHGGVDYQGILRAGVKDIFSGGRSTQGASTLTMQLVDNIYLPNKAKVHRDIKYKIVQAKLAEQLEHKLKKWQILNKYLNDVDYGTLGGQSAIGVAAASELFFNKPVSKLDLAQAALLAGLPQAPSQYNPFVVPKTATARRHDVLQSMVKSGYITQARADVADSSPLELQRNDHYNGLSSQPYVFDFVQQELRQKYCPSQPPTAACPRVDQGGLKVYTTIDTVKQDQARQAIANNEGQPGDPSAAVVTVDPSNGHILAMQTSSTYGRTNGQTTFDYATQSHRQTGSAFKTFVLMTLIHDFDGDPNQTYYNSHELQPGWLPGYPTYHVQTSELSYQGNISVAKATVVSDNTVFAQLDADVTPDKVRDTAYHMGITSHLAGLPSEGLGAVGVSPLEMADAYATLANGGNHIPPTAITKVIFPTGQVDTTLGAPPKTQVFPDGEAYAATQVLKGVIANGTGTAAQFGCPAAGKTGTTSNYTDAWFVGYTPRLSTAVWVGFPDSTISMNDVNGLGPGFGGTLAAPIWHDYMARATGGYCGDFPSPTDTFSGKAFFGKYASTGNAGTSPGGSGQSGSSSSGGGTFGSQSTTQTNPSTNPQPGSSQPSPPGSGGTGVGPPGTQPGSRNPTGPGTPQSSPPTPSPTPSPGNGAPPRLGGAPPPRH
ncbi:MAG: transglycosylase domain-containing protein [Solirubrobacteraceae bacterium]